MPLGKKHSGRNQRPGKTVFKTAGRTFPNPAGRASALSREPTAISIRNSIATLRKLQTLYKKQGKSTKRITGLINSLKESYQLFISGEMNCAERDYVVRGKIKASEEFLRKSA